MLWPNFNALDDRAGECVVDSIRPFVVFNPRPQHDLANLIANVMGGHP